MTTYRIYESGNYLIIDTYDDVARVVTASAQYAKKNSYYNKTATGYVITEFGGGEFPILLSDIAANIWTDNASVPLSESEIVDILQNQTGNFKSAAGGSAAVGAAVGAVLMKTGQTTSFRTGDDGDIEAGRATDFFTLATNNPFGNTNRFTDELGGSTYTNNIVIDWSTYDGSTVLGYVKNFATLGMANWDTAIDNSLAYSVGTFTTGWRLTNRNEINNICNMNNATFPLNYAPFNVGFGGATWTSNTLMTNTNYAWYLYNSLADIRYQQKTTDSFYIPCRTFTVTGTTLT